MARKVKTLLQKKTPLTINRTRIQVIADSIDLAASAVNHCATKTPLAVLGFCSGQLVSNNNYCVSLVPACHSQQFK